jgi:hypothetical protein
MRRRLKKLTLYSALAGTVIVPLPALGQTLSPEEEIQLLRRELETHRKQLEAQQRRVEQLEIQVMSSKPSPRGRGLGPASAPAEPPLAQAPSQKAPVGPVGQAPDTSRPPEVPALVDIRGVLTPRNTLTIEPSLQYSHSSNNRVSILGFAVIPAITIGLIDIRSVSRDAFIGAVSARYGITNRFEVEAKVPWVYRHDATLSRPFASPAANDAVFDASGSGLGDVELSARYQLNQPGPDRPYYIGGLRVKTRTGTGPFEVTTETTNAQFLGLQRELPTGSGFYGVQPSLTAIFPSDPAVFFGNVSYLANIRRDFGGTIGSIDPGDVAGFTVGMGLALNEKASFSIGYDHATIFRTKQNGAIVPNTTSIQLGSLLLGLSYRLSPKKVLSFTLGAGLTQEAPNVQLTFRLPMEM